MRAHALAGPSEYAGGDATPQPPAVPWFLRFQPSCLPVASPKGPPWAAAHGLRAAVRCYLPLQRPLGRITSRAHHSMSPSGAQAVHSTSPSGTKVGICAVARKYCATRCHRVARPSRTRRHRVARSGIADPAPATSRIPRCIPQSLQRRLRQGDRASERRPLTSHERAGQLVASPPAHSWGHPIPATEWVCVTHVLWRRTHTSMHEVSKGYLK